MGAQSGERSTLRRRLWPWRRRRSRATFALAGLPLALVLAWPAASVQAAVPTAARAPALCIIFCVGGTPTPAPTQSSSGCLLGVLNCPAPIGTTATPPASGCLLGLLCAPANPPANPSPTSPCVAGVLLCPNNGIVPPTNVPTPCVAGVVLCGTPPASPCVAGAVLCPVPTVSPTDSPSPGGGPPGTKTGPGGLTGGSAPLGSSTVALLGAPGVGLVPRIDGTNGNAAANGLDPNPDAYTELLSLSIRDGLRVGGFQLWPLLAALQAILLVVVVGVYSARRMLQAPNLPGD